MFKKLRWLAIVAAMVSLFVISTGALAAPAPKTADVTITMSVNGSVATLTARTLKTGLAYADTWDGATKVSTVLDADGYYVSTATFSAAEAGDYTVTYAITMTAGRSAVTWTGSAALTITVGAAGDLPPGGGGAGTNI